MRGRREAQYTAWECAGAHIACLRIVSIKALYPPIIILCTIPLGWGRDIGKYQRIVYKHFLHLERRIPRHWYTQHTPSSGSVLCTTRRILRTLVHVECQPLFLPIPTQGSL